MASVSIQVFAPVPSDNENSNRIATMRNLQVLNTNFAPYGSRITSLEGTFTSYGTRIGNLETNYGNLSTTVSNLNTTVGGYGTRIGTLEGNYNTLNTNYGTINTNVTTLQNQMTTANNNISSLQGKVRYDIAIFSSGTCLSSERIFDFTAPIAFTLPGNLTGTVIKARVAPTTAFAFSIRKNGQFFGTINFAANAVTGTAATSATNIAVGDQIDIVAPSATDAISDISITLVGSR